MSIIKCPECGHQVSDKAPVCPNCGVEIAGKIKKKSYGNKSMLIISVIFAIIVLGVCVYVYNKAQSDKEAEQYEIAINSNDTMVLQSYLDNFKDAPQEHIDSINKHIERMNAASREWTNAMVSGSKAALMEYINKHPDSQHRNEALNKIDSIDWAQCVKTNTADAYQLYIDSHNDGNHYDEAQLALKGIRAVQITPEERQRITSTFKQFFLSINEKDETTLTSTVSDIINFLGKTAATKDDIVSFMHKLYKPDIENLIWSLSKDFKIDKTEVGDGVYEYSVTFMANEKVTKTDKSDATTQYRISAKIDSDGKISDMAMTKIVE